MKRIFASLISAFHAGTTLQFGGVNNEICPGACTNIFCLDMVSLIK